jgi:hypothetical protein
MFKKGKEKIRVCIRVRPILEHYEDSRIWEISSNGKSIFTVSPSNFNDN